MIRINLLPADLRRGNRLPPRVLAAAFGAALLCSAAVGWLGLVYFGDLARAEQELEESLLAIAERPEAQIGLGNLYAEAGDAGRSEAAFRRAMTLDPALPGPRVNLADLYRRLDRDPDAEALLREGLAADGFARTT